MKKVLIGILAMASFSAYADMPTFVDCGKVSKVKYTRDENVEVKLVDSKAGQFSVEGKITLNNEVRDSIKVTLIPSRLDTDAQQAAPFLASSKLKAAKESKDYVCISYPFSSNAMNSGFPHEIGIGTTIEDAVKDLESNRKL